MIEIATCMNDLSAGAVWVHKTSGREARIRSVWVTREESGVGVGIDLLGPPMAEGEAAIATMDAEKFRNYFTYAPSHVQNNAREAEKTRYLMERALSSLSDCFDVESRMEGRELLKKLTTLAKRMAGHEVLIHEGDDDGTCCYDAVSSAADKLLAENTLTAKEIEELIK